MPLVIVQITASLKCNIKEGAFKHIIELLIDFYNNKSSIEVVEVIKLGEWFVNLIDY